MTDINFFEGSLLTSYVVPIITTKLQCNQNIPPQIQTIDKKFPHFVKYATYLKEVNGLNKSFWDLWRFYETICTFSLREWS